MKQFYGLQPRIVSSDPKRLAGKQLDMSLLDDKTSTLWKSFMPLLASVHNRADNNLVSLQVYDTAYFNAFNPARSFTKWAGVFVNDGPLPTQLEELIIPEGTYAIFDYKGPAGDSAIFQYIFSAWLPQSVYQLDYRPHFEILGPKYRNNDPASEEEIWIPVRKRINE